MQTRKVRMWLKDKELQILRVWGHSWDAFIRMTLRVLYERGFLFLTLTDILRNSRFPQSPREARNLTARVSRKRLRAPIFETRLFRSDDDTRRVASFSSSKTDSTYGQLMDNVCNWKRMNPHVKFHFFYLFTNKFLSALLKRFIVIG